MQLNRQFARCPAAVECPVIIEAWCPTAVECPVIIEVAYDESSLIRRGILYSDN
jgi:hypothetical protein